MKFKKLLIKPYDFKAFLVICTSVYFFTRSNMNLIGNANYEIYNLLSIFCLYDEDASFMGTMLNAICQEEIYEVALAYYLVSY